MTELDRLFGDGQYRIDRPHRQSLNRRCSRPGATGEPQMVLGEEAGTYLRHPDDGLIARVVQSHSLDKAWYARRYAEIVGSALAGKFELWWVELFAGPGRLWVAPEHRFADGSPLDALKIRKPFDGYFFSDIDRECTDALAARTEGLHDNLHIATGSANAREIHEQIFALVPQRAVVVLYLDPRASMSTSTPSRPSHASTREST